MFKLARTVEPGYHEWMGQADRIRRLAARRLAPEAIASRLKLRPSVVRRVLDRSAQRGAPARRGVSVPLSFVTTPEVARKLRVRADHEGIALSKLIDQLLRDAIADAAAVDSEERAPVDQRHVLRTAQDAPESVVRLLKSYDPAALRWDVDDHRHTIIVAVLTRGCDDAKRWLWSVLPREEVRTLVRSYGGAGCAEPDRVLLREQLGLTATDIPSRPYLGLERLG